MGTPYDSRLITVVVALVESRHEPVVHADGHPCKVHPDCTAVARFRESLIWLRSNDAYVPLEDGVAILAFLSRQRRNGTDCNPALRERPIAHELLPHDALVFDGGAD